MKRNSLISKVLYVSFALVTLNCLTSVAAALNRPKLVVGIVVDQMRWDYLYRYYDLYGEGGFKRLLHEGYNCENTMINYGQIQLASATLRKIFEKRFGWGEKI